MKRLLSAFLALVGVAVAQPTTPLANVRFQGTNNSVVAGASLVPGAGTITANAFASAATLSTALDLLGSTRGSVLIRGASGWVILAPGTSGYVLASAGAGADPTWVAQTGGGGTPGGSPGDIQYNNSGSFGGYTIVPVASGGTGAATMTANNVILGNGTSAVQFVAPGSNGNVLTSNGTTWSSTTPGVGGTVTSIPDGSTNGVTWTVATRTTTPTFTFSLGAITPTTVNGNTFTTGTGTLTLGAGKTLTASNTLTFAGTDSSSVNFGAGGTVLYSGGSFVSSIAGTANEITASASTGAVTLSLPTALTFTGKTVTGGTFASGAFNGTLGASTPSSVAATTGALSGVLSANDTTEATSSAGSIVSLGGISAAKKVFATQLNSTVSTGTAPLVVASTTNVANLNASSLSGATFASPGTIGGGTPGAATFTTLLASTSITDSALTAGQVTFAGTAGLLSGDSGLTYNAGTDTLTVVTAAATTVNATNFSFGSSSGPLITTSGTVSNPATLDVTLGGTGRATGTTAYGLLAAGTTATGAQQTLAAGATTEILVGGGASALPVWTTAQGSGAPVRATSPTLTTPNIGVATGTSLALSGAVSGTTGTFSTLTSGRVPIVSTAGLLADSSTFTYSTTAGLGAAPTNTATSGSITGVAITPTYNQASGTAANTDLLINRTETAIGSGAQNLIDAQVAGTSKFSVSNAGTVIATGATDASFRATNGTSTAFLQAEGDGSNSPRVILDNNASNGVRFDLGSVVESTVPSYRIRNADAGTNLLRIGATGTLTLSPAGTTALTLGGSSGAATIAGGAGNMTITSGTGNSRTMALQTTTSGGAATTAVTIGADQGVTFTPTNTASVAITATPSDASSTAFSISNILGGTTNTQSVTGLNFDVRNNASSGINYDVFGSGGNVRSTGAASVATMTGSRVISIVSGGGTVTSSYGYVSRTPTVSSGAITTHYGFFAQDSKPTGVTTGYGFYQEGATSLNYFAGNVGIGATAPATTLHVVDTGTSNPRGITNDQYNTGTNSAQINLRKARGTLASPTTIVTGDVLSRLISWGHDGSNFIETGNIRFTSSGTIAATRVPSQFEVWTSTDATPSVLTKQLTIDSTGKATFTAGITSTNAEKLATFVVDGGGSAITTGTVSGTSTIPYACTLTGWSISATAATGTNTIKIWNTATGTAIPTIANVINTSGVSLTTGTNVKSTTLSDFTDTSYAAYDMFRCAVTAVDGAATDLTVTLYGTRN